MLKFTAFRKSTISMGNLEIPYFATFWRTYYCNCVRQNELISTKWIWRSTLKCHKVKIILIFVNILFMRRKACIWCSFCFDNINEL